LPDRAVWRPPSQKRDRISAPAERFARTEGALRAAALDAAARADALLGG
jgi:hypothetical protein